MKQAQARTVNVDVGIAAPARAQIVEGLSRLLAETFALYLKTHHFHWNVTGPMFPTLHAQFETEYTELWEALDVLAERIRALGAPAPGALATLTRLSTIQDDEHVPEAMDMVRKLLGGHETVIRAARALVPIAEEASDAATVDLLTDRLKVHEKDAWMLRALLG